MQTGNSRTARLLKYFTHGIFFIIIFLFFLLYASHIFIYQEKHSLFILSVDYLHDFLKQPGSLLKYIAGFIASFYYYPAAGAVIASTVIFSTVVLLSQITKLLKGSEDFVIPFLSGILMFYLQTNYQYMLFNNLGILLQLAMAYVFIRYGRGYWPVIILPLWYFINGGFAWMLYGIYGACLIVTGFKKNLLKIVLLLALAAVTVFISVEFLFYRPWLALLIYPWSPGYASADNIIFTILGGLICLTPFICWFKIPYIPEFINTPNPQKKQHLRLLTAFSGISLIIATLLTTAFLRYDKKTENYFLAEKLFYEGRYDELVRFNLKNPTKNIITLFLGNIALCETGRLNEMLFSFPQSPDGSTLFQKWETDIKSEILKHGGNFYYTIGMINEAYRWAYENMVLKGHTPDGLRMMIKCELINGNYKNAEIFINLLKKTLFYRKEAAVLEKMLFNDDAVSSHPELGAKKKIRPGIDFFTITDDPVINIERIVATDSMYINRNAWEYKMAWHLLNKDLKGIAQVWQKLDLYGYKIAPKHLQEAALAMRTLLKIELSAQEKLKITADTEKRYAQFLQTFQLSGYDLAKAEPLLRKNFGNTFWYYMFYK